MPRSCAPVVTIRRRRRQRTGLRVSLGGADALRERIAPLNKQITKLGRRRWSAGPRRDGHAHRSRGGRNPGGPRRCPSPRAQYEDLRDEQLAQPAFVPLQGGLTVAAEDLAVDDDAGPPRRLPPMRRCCWIRRGRRSDRRQAMCSRRQC